MSKFYFQKHFKWTTDTMAMLMSWSKCIVPIKSWNIIPTKVPLLWHPFIMGFISTHPFKDHSTMVLGTAISKNNTPSKETIILIQGKYHKTPFSISISDLFRSIIITPNIPWKHKEIWNKFSRKINLIWFPSIVIYENRKGTEIIKSTGKKEQRTWKKKTIIFLIMMKILKLTLPLSIILVQGD